MLRPLALLATLAAALAVPASAQTVTDVGALGAELTRVLAYFPETDRTLATGTRGTLLVGREVLTLAAGVYVVRMTAPGFAASRTVTVVR